LLLIPLLAALAAACGGSGGASAEPAVDVVTVETTPAASPAPAGSIRALLEETPGEDVALVFGSRDFAVGENRISFLVVRGNGELVDAPRARVSVATGNLDALPAVETTAENLPVGVAGDELDTGSVWVTSLDLEQPGLYTLLVEPEGTDLQAVGNIEVAAESAAPAVGDKAVPSDTPTVADGFPEDITTARPPDTELLRYSVKESIEDGFPFVVTFATPLYCESRVCGPVVDVVDEVRERNEQLGVRFIHVEIYEGNDPANGPNRWFNEWNLPSEPYTFLVGADGVIRARFEGLVTVDELERAVRDLLL
jgi:hypothetical protein